MQYAYTTSAGNLAYTCQNSDELLTKFTTADPQIILRYYTRNPEGSGAYYDGFTFVSAENAPNLPANAMCYLGTGFSAKPHIEDLTAAQFVPRSAYESSAAKPHRWNYNDMTFPFDDSSTCVGSFVIPKSAYSGTNEVYAYLWLPSPEFAEELSSNYNVDLTMLAPDSVGIEVMKFSAALFNDDILNETVVSAIHNANCSNFRIGSGYDVESADFYHIDLIEDSYISRSTFDKSNYVTATVDTIRNCTFANNSVLDLFPLHVGLLSNCGTINMDNRNFSAATVSACDYYIDLLSYGNKSDFIDSNVYIGSDTLLGPPFPQCKYTNCNVTLSSRFNYVDRSFILDGSTFNTNFTDNASYGGYVSAKNSTLNITGGYLYNKPQLELIDSTATLVSNSQYTTGAQISATRSYVNGTYYEAYTGTI